MRTNCVNQMQILIAQIYQCINMTLTSDNEFFENFTNIKLHEHVLKHEQNMKEIYHKVFHEVLEYTERQSVNRNRHKLAKELKVGDLVFKTDFSNTIGYSRKLKPYRNGPYKVARVVSKVTYDLEPLDQIHKKCTTHRNHLLPYNPKEVTLPTLVEKYQIENALAGIDKQNFPDEWKEKTDVTTRDTTVHTPTVPRTTTTVPTEHDYGQTDNDFFDFKISQVIQVLQTYLQQYMQWSE
jgi:hypothetical protein